MRSHPLRPNLLRPERYCALTLAERIDFADDLAVFRFWPAERLRFAPGQYATLALAAEDLKGPLQRPYSVASAPHEEVMDFFIERVEGGALTPRLWDLAPGARCWVRRRIVGRFVLDESAERSRHVMAATVTGIAPYVSIARAQQHALKAGKRSAPHRLLILHGASRSWELGFYRDELADIERAGWLTYVPTVSRPWEDPAWTGERGRVGDVLRKHMDAQCFTAEHAVGYACGHPLMIQNVRTILARAGFEKGHVHEEKYFRA